MVNGAARGHRTGSEDHAMQGFCSWVGTLMRSRHERVIRDQRPAGIDLQNRTISGSGELLNLAAGARTAKEPAELAANGARRCLAQRT